MATKSVTSVSTTGSNSIDSLLSGTRWSDGNISFSFPTASSTWPTRYTSDNEPTTGFVALNPQQQTAARSALSAWASVANLSFSEVPDNVSGSGVIRFGTSSAPSTSWAYYPSTSEVGGDVWFGNVNSNAPINPIKGNYSYATYIHELGHALGLKHPHDTNGSSIVSYSSTDSIEYSIMSYRSYVGAPLTGYTVGNTSFPTGPMMDDIAAIQYMYGAKFNGPANQVYHFDPNQSKIFETIWDGGGNATYDCSAYTTGVKLDLRPGHWSTLSSSQLSDLGSGHTAVGNVANAYQYNNDSRSLIRVGIGGSGDDFIYGNEGGCVFDGGKGNDALFGGTAGYNTSVFEDRASDYVVLNVGTTTFVSDISTSNRNTGNDILYNIQGLQFVDTAINNASHSYQNFDALSYIASYGDLVNYFGTNQDGATNHYAYQGFYEHRKATFDGLAYIASYGDLINAFGANKTTGETHFIINGYKEGRSSTFDGLAYIASYGDLIGAFHSNKTAGETHYINAGYHEGRKVTFNASQYLAANPDLQAVYGSDTLAATRHYIESGYYEGRKTSANSGATPAAPSSGTANPPAPNESLYGTSTPASTAAPQNTGITSSDISAPFLPDSNAACDAFALTAPISQRDLSDLLPQTYISQPNQLAGNIAACSDSLTLQSSSLYALAASDLSYLKNHASF